MINFDYVTKENIKEHNPNCPKIPDNLCRILIMESSGSGIIYANLIYAKDSYEPKYQFLITKRESAGLKHFNDSKTFIEYLNDINDIQILKNTI